jgi:hypothetical protein
MLPPEILKHAKDGKALALELVRLDHLVERFGYNAIVREVLDAADPPLLIAMLYFTEWSGTEIVCQSLIDHGKALHASGFPEAEYATWTAEARAFLLHRILN